MTTTRLAKAGVLQEASACIFCGRDSDTLEHMAECVVLNDVRGAIREVTHIEPSAWRPETLMLQRDTDGATLGLVVAFFAIVWSLRAYFLREGRRPERDALAQLIITGIDCPWLLCFEAELTKKERRKTRVQEPRPLGNAAVYRSDGASRREARASAGEASFGVAFWHPHAKGPPGASFRAAIGEASNNVAEYRGLREGMLRAVRREEREIVFEVDSKLVARHMAKEVAWVCRDEELRPLYEECRLLGARLTAQGKRWEVRHIYWEFNQVADPLANQALDDPGGNGPSVSW